MTENDGTKFDHELLQQQMQLGSQDGYMDELRLSFPKTSLKHGLYGAGYDHAQLAEDIENHFQAMEALADDEERKSMDEAIEQGNRVHAEALAQLGNSIPVNRVQGPPKPRVLPNLSHLKPAVEKITSSVTETTKAMQDLSDKLDRDRAKQKHEWSAVEFSWGSYLICACGIEAHSEKMKDEHDASVKRARSKKPYERPEHLTDRPFVHNEGLRALQKQLHAEARQSIPTKRSNRASNPKAKRQR